MGKEQLKRYFIYLETVAHGYIFWGFLDEVSPEAAIKWVVDHHMDEFEYLFIDDKMQAIDFYAIEVGNPTNMAVVPKVEYELKSGT